MSCHQPIPNISKPFPDKVVIIVQLAAPLLKLAPYNAGTPTEKLASATIQYARKVAAEMMFAPVIKPTAYFMWNSSMGSSSAAPSVCYGVIRRPLKSGAARFRIEFNPAHTNANHLKRIEDDIQELLGLGIPFKELLATAYVKEIHVAIDADGPCLGDLIIVGRNKAGSTIPRSRSPGKICTYWSNRHGHETTYHHCGERKPRKLLRVYNKGLEQFEKGKTGDLEPISRTRIERVVLDHEIHLSELSNLSNPFAALGIADIGEGTTNLSDEFRCLADSIRVRGLNAALSLHPSFTSDAWNAFQKEDASWWQPKKMWKQWPESLNSGSLGKWIALAKT
jgi:hypothetical protein